MRVASAGLVYWVARFFLLGTKARILGLTFVNGQFDTAAAAAAKSLQSCPTLCDPIDRSPPGSPIPGVFQARVLEWGAIAFSEFDTIEAQI